MQESKDVLQQEDVNNIAKSEIVPWSVFQGKSILVTGATGLIGSLLVKSIVCRNRIYGSNIKIYAMVRNLEKGRKIFPEFESRENFEFVCGDINEDYELPEKLNFVVHAACATDSKSFVSSPVEIIRTMVGGTDRVLSKVASKNLEGFLYLSSLEVYGTPQDGIVDVPENYNGYIDQMQVRSSYSEGKRMVECLCSAYAAEYKIPIKVARLTQTFGTGVFYEDNRVFAQFARSAIEGKNIVLKTKGETLRSYCYVADAVNALLLILAKGVSGEAYNVANEKTAISIADMAKFVCDNFSDGKSKVVFDIVDDASKLGYNPVMKISLNTAKLKSLGWSAKYDMYEMYSRTIESMKGN